MTGRARTPRALLAVGSAVLAVLLTSCTGQDVTPSAQSPAPTQPVDASQPAATVAPTPTGEPTGLATLEPVVPTDSQADAYLEGRVPDGVDPAAVLEAGVEACDRMHYLAAVDARVLVETLRSDPAADDWPDAVATLCPDLASYVTEARA